MPPKSTLGKPKYSEGEKVLCFHGPLLYEAKCLSIDVKEGHIKYFVHYQGWNKNWDEWVGDARIMKFNAVGLQKQKELKEFYTKQGKKVKGLRKSDLRNQEYPPPEALRRLEEASVGIPPPSAASATAGSSSSSSRQPAATANKQRHQETAAAAATAAPTSTPARQTPLQLSSQQQQQHPTSSSASKRTREISASAAADADQSAVGDASASVGCGGSVNVSGGKKLRIQIELPRPLKLWLADDADLVQRQRRLHSLPPAPAQTVASILGRFVTTQSAASSADELERERLSEFAAGLQSYFNATLASQLLYASERSQFAGLLRSHRNAMPASLYGCLHLLRLFVRLGDLLSHTKLDLKCLNSLLDYCDAFLLFLEKNMDVFVNAASYEAPDPRLATA